MATSLQYIRNYGCVSFKEKPFGDADNVALCEVFYMPLEKAAMPGFDAAPVAFDELCRELYRLNGNRHVAPGLVLQKKISRKMMEMAQYPRFAQMKVTGFLHVFATQPVSVQFCAATFLLPDNTVVVVFRGTDDSITGWVEDIDILTKRGIPSHKLAVDYLEEVARRFAGDIIVCGHSKGGNVAQYAALNCSGKTRDRIKILYNNEGPGFNDFSYLASPAYRELLPRYRHFVPESSFVGMMLAHDDDYVTVRSYRISGALQHDLSSWKIKNDEVVTTDGLTLMGKFNDILLLNLVMGIKPEDYPVMDEVAGALRNNSGQFGLSDLTKQPRSFVNGVARAWNSVDKSTRRQFIEAFSGTAKLMALSVKAIRDEAIPTVSKRAADLASALFA